METVEFANCKSDKLYLSLREQALQGKAGEHFRTIRELMKSYAVSQLVVDRAVSKLCAEGVLTAVKGKGLFISHPGVPASSGRPGSVLVLYPRWVATDINILHQKAAELSAHSATPIECVPFDFVHPIPRNLDAQVSSAAGVIILPASGPMLADDIICLYRYLRLAPTVVMSRHLDNIGIPCVGLDDHYSAQLAMHWLCQHGHRRIGILLSEPHNPIIMTRVDAAQDYGRMFGLEVKIFDVGTQNGEMAATKTYHYFSDAIDRGLGVTAILGVSGESISGAVNACNNHHLDIPRDLSIVAIASEENTETMFPPLDTLPALMSRQIEIALGLIEQMRASTKRAQPALPLSCYLKNDILSRGSVCRLAGPKTA